MARGLQRGGGSSQLESPSEANKDHFHTRDHFNAGEVRLVPQSNTPPESPQSFNLTCTCTYTTVHVPLAAR